MTFEDIEVKLDNYTRRELIFGMMNLCYDLSKEGVITSKTKIVKNYIRAEFGNRSVILFWLALISGILFKKGFFLLQKAKGRKAISRK